MEQLCQPSSADDMEDSSKPSSKVLASLVANRTEANDRALKQSLADYGPDRLMLQGLGADVV